MTVKSFIRAFQPCAVGQLYLEECGSLEEAWEGCNNSFHLLWAIEMLGKVPYGEVKENIRQQFLTMLGDDPAVPEEQWGEQYSWEYNNAMNGKRWITAEEGYSLYDMCSSLIYWAGQCVTMENIRNKTFNDCPHQAKAKMGVRVCQVLREHIPYPL